MSFDSLAFFVFLPVVVALHFLAPARAQWVVLLGASWFFYAWWKPEYLVLLLVPTVVDYSVGRLLAGEARPVRRRVYLGASLVVNLGLLFVFKYAHFVSTAAHKVLPGLRVVDVVLPVGISFYTFQTIGYGIDVYRRKYEPETHFGRFALFVSFFPHLVAGPIMRAPALLPQFRKPQAWDYDRAVSGLALMAWGVFKKVVIADRAALFVNAVYGDPARFQGATVVVATYLFAFQIYCDFAGYSDIAVGAARILGFRLMDNFDRPYLAPTLRDFWRRWHISLSTWFFDYVYTPLGGSHAGTSRLLANVFLVFVLSGFWHGANWTLLLWGAYHGALMVVTIGLGFVLAPLGERVRRSPALAAVARFAGVVLTFHLVCFGWLLFRATGLGHIRLLLSRLPVALPVGVVHELIRAAAPPTAARAFDLVTLAAAIVTMEAVEWLVRSERATRVPAPIRWVAWATLAVALLVLAVQTHAPFLYFQF